MAMVQLLAMAKDFSLLQCPDCLCGLSSLLSNGYWGLSPSKEVGAHEKWWSYPSTPPYAFTAWCLIKHRDYITFSLLHK
jgi:hypothetical protein